MNHLSHQSLVPGTAVILLLATLSQPAGLRAEAVRGELENLPGGIVIAATPPSGTAVYAVEEDLPLGAFPRRISHEGFFDIQTNKVKWGPFFDDLPRDLTFEIAIGDGDPTLTGTMSHDDSGSLPTTGIDDIVLPGLETYFVGWQNRYLPMNTPLLSANYVVPGASLPLLVQYAMGREPGEPGSPFRITLLAHGQTEVRYIRDRRRADVSIQLQTSDDLSEWIPWDPPSAEVEVIDAFREAVQVPAHETRPFHRVRVWIP
jgi:hypothetical protein